MRWVPATTDGGVVRFRHGAAHQGAAAAKVLVLADPANPTGGEFAPDDLEQIAWWANKFDVLIYCDESFGRFRFDGDHVSRRLADQGRETDADRRQHDVRVRVGGGPRRLAGRVPAPGSPWPMTAAPRVHSCPRRASLPPWRRCGNRPPVRETFAGEAALRP